MIMKKYLMTGVAALAICAAFTSCSKSEELYDQDVAKGISKEQAVANVYNSYNQAFIQTFGQPAANQDWGFGTRAGTRGLNDDPTIEQGKANKNRNLWAATDGKFNLLVPTPLTAEQCNRVRAYFQTHRYLTWETPDMTNYFVQQVYTGGTNTAGSLSTEQYREANNTPVVGAAHMDQLTVTGNNVHVNDFNGADNPNIATDVLNNGELTNSNKFHSDQITLMIGIQPTCVGYQTSEASLQHNDCCALVSAKVIDDWARSLDTPIGEDVWYGKDQYGYDNSFWERSFVGLDYEQKTIETLYKQKNGSDYARIKDFMSKSMNWILYNGRMVAANTIDIDADLRFPNNEKVRWIDDNTNQFLGENLGTTQNTFNKQGTKEWFKTNYNVDVTNGSEDYFDLDALYSYINQGAYPKLNNMEFIKNIGGRDYVFSDWIVTLAPAKENTITTDWDLRIMAEDLNAKADNGGSDDSDWDFNDVVLDVKFLGDNEVKVRVVAAGGTLPLRINGEGSLEVHGLYGQATGIMINTCRTAALQQKHPNHYNSSTYPEFTRTISGVKAAKGKNIKLEVYKKLSNGDEDWVEMTATTGVPAAKFAVKPTVDYCNERQHISNKYNMFGQWVQTAGDLVWYNPD